MINLRHKQLVNETMFQNKWAKKIYSFWCPTFSHLYICKVPSLEFKKKNVNPWPKFNSMIYFVLGEYCSPFILKSKHVSKIYVKSCKMTWPSIGGLRAKHELASQYHHSLLFWKWICAIMHILGLFFLIYKLKLVFFFI